MKIYVINILRTETFSLFTLFIHIPFIIISLHKYLWTKLSKKYIYRQIFYAGYMTGK